MIPFLLLNTKLKFINALSINLSSLLRPLTNPCRKLSLNYFKFYQRSSAIYNKIYPKISSFKLITFLNGNKKQKYEVSDFDITLQRESTLHVIKDHHFTVIKLAPRYIPGMHKMNSLNLKLYKK